MESIINQVNKLSQEAGNVPIYTAPCKENSCSILKKDSLVVITDRTLDIYSQGQGALRCSIPWLSIASISIEGSEIKLKFEKKNVTIYSDTFANSIFGAIVHTLQQILTSFETKCLSLDTYNVPRAKHSGVGALVRFTELIKKNELLISPNALNNFKLALMESKKEVSVSEFGDPTNIIPLFLSVSPICNFESVILPQINGYPMYKIISEYAPAIARLKYIDIPGKANDGFDNFFKALKAQTASQLRGISFTNTEFTGPQLIKLSEFIGDTKLSALGLHNSLTIDSYPTFYAEFFNSAMIGGLVVLNLDGTKNLDIARLFPVLRHIYVLSLEDCGLHIDRVFTQISLSGIRNLRALNVSKNLCEHFPSSSMSVPSSLISLVANNVRWCDLCLSNMLKLLFFRPSNLKLSIANASASQAEWNTVFQFLGTTRYENLVSLTWDGNPLNANLFTYITRNTQLEYLSMCNCFTQTEPATIATFSKILETCPSLKFLLLKGSPQRSLGRLVGSITRVAIAKKTLIHLDIGDNRLGDQGLLQIKALFTSRNSLKMVNFDGSNPQTPQALFDILELASRVQEQIHTSFPINDMLKLKENNLITQEIFDQHLRKFQRAPKLKASSKVSQNYSIPMNSVFLSPFNVFVDEPTATFPKYLSKDEIQDLREMPEKPFIRTKSEIEFTSNKVYSGTMGRPPKKPILAKDIFGNQNPNQQQQQLQNVQPRQQPNPQSNIQRQSQQIIYQQQQNQTRPIQNNNMNMRQQPQQQRNYYQQRNAYTAPSTPKSQNNVNMRQQQQRQQIPQQRQQQQYNRNPSSQSVRPNSNFNMRNDSFIDSDDYVPMNQQLKRAQPTPKQIIAVPNPNSFSEYYSDENPLPTPPPPKNPIPQPQPQQQQQQPKKVHRRRRRQQNTNQVPPQNQQPQKPVQKQPSRKNSITSDDLQRPPPIQTRYTDDFYSYSDNSPLPPPPSPPVVKQHRRRRHRKQIQNDQPPPFQPQQQQQAPRQRHPLRNIEIPKNHQLFHASSDYTNYDDYSNDNTTTTTDYSYSEDVPISSRRRRRSNQDQQRSRRAQSVSSRRRQPSDDYSDDDYEYDDEINQRRNHHSHSSHQIRNERRSHSSQRHHHNDRRSASSRRSNYDVDNDRRSVKSSSQRRDESDRRSVKSTSRRNDDDRRSVRSSTSRRVDDDRRSVKSISRRNDDDRRSVKSTSRRNDDDRRSVKSTSRRNDDDRRSVRSTSRRRDVEDDRRSQKSRRDDSDRRSVKSSYSRRNNESDRRSVKSRNDKAERRFRSILSDSDDFYNDSGYDEPAPKRRSDSKRRAYNYERDRKSLKKGRSDSGSSDEDYSDRSNDSDYDDYNNKRNTRNRNERRTRSRRQSFSSSLDDLVSPPPSPPPRRVQKVDARKLNALREFSGSGDDTFSYDDYDSDIPAVKRVRKW